MLSKILKKQSFVVSPLGLTPPRRVAVFALTLEAADQTRHQWSWASSTSFLLARSQCSECLKRMVQVVRAQAGVGVTPTCPHSFFPTGSM